MYLNNLQLYMVIKLSACLLINNIHHIYNQRRFVKKNSNNNSTSILLLYIISLINVASKIPWKTCLEK